MIKNVDDTKVTDHHALLATENIRQFDMNPLIPQNSEKLEGVSREVLRNILDLVITRVVVSFSNAYIYEEIFSNGFEFQDFKQSLNVIYNEFISLTNEIKDELESRGLDMRLEKQITSDISGKLMK